VLTATVDIVQCYCVCVKLVVVTAILVIVQCYCVVCVEFIVVTAKVGIVK